MKRRIVLTVDVPEDGLAHFIGGVIYGAASRAIESTPSLKDKAKIVDYEVFE